MKGELAPDDGAGKWRNPGRPAVAGTGRIAGSLRINTPRLAALHLFAAAARKLPRAYPDMSWISHR